MGDIVLHGAAGQQHQLDLLPGERDSDGYRNVLPGYHVLRVRRDDGQWLGHTLFTPVDGERPHVDAFRLDGERLLDARHEPLPPRDRLRDVLARDSGVARAWQAATSALDAAFYAQPPTDKDAFGLPVLQAMFAHVAFCDPHLPSPSMTQLCARLGDHARLAADPAAGVELARAVGAMIALVPPLAVDLRADELVGALSLVGNARGQVDLIAAASRLQLQLSKQN